MFFSSVSCCDLFKAEISAILKACMLVASPNCPTGFHVIIESDSKSVVAWVNNVVGIGNVKNMDAILDIREIIKRVGFIKVQFVPRSDNTTADVLAKLRSLSCLVQEVWDS
ncbi:hypothetical protein LWI28_019695 [Acer negundo]|uniref:RNase H type-1 domain-containing protein n=1 Tax=Acer negundo TaxID=4023 RepID=A0AAD5NF87_ACENE|nr:hypothetical protein LWI28_019695 [Acer negundo]